MWGKQKGPPFIEDLQETPLPVQVSILKYIEICCGSCKCGLLLRINMNQNLMSRVLLHSNQLHGSTRLCKFPCNCRSVRLKLFHRWRTDWSRSCRASERCELRGYQALRCSESAGSFSEVTWSGQAARPCRAESAVVTTCFFVVWLNFILPPCRVSMAHSLLNSTHPPIIDKWSLNSRNRCSRISVVSKSCFHSRQEIPDSYMFSQHGAHRLQRSNTSLEPGPFFAREQY